MKKTILTMIGILALTSTNAQKNCYGSNYETYIDLIRQDDDAAKRKPTKALQAFTMGKVIYDCLAEGGEWYGLQWGDTMRDKVNIKYYTSHNDVIAYAESPGVGDLTIVIDAMKWLKLNPYQREWLITHEYLHERFSLKHGSIEIMFPYMPVLSELTGRKGQEKLRDVFYDTYKYLEDNGYWMYYDDAN